MAADVALSKGKSKRVLTIKRSADDLQLLRMRTHCVKREGDSFQRAALGEVREMDVISLVKLFLP